MDFIFRTFVVELFILNVLLQISIWKALKDFFLVGYFHFVSMQANLWNVKHNRIAVFMNTLRMPVKGTAIKEMSFECFKKIVFFLLHVLSLIQNKLLNSYITYLCDLLNN